MEQEYRIRVEQRPDEETKRYYPDNIPETFWKWAKNCYETIELE